MHHRCWVLTEDPKARKGKDQGKVFPPFPDDQMSEISDHMYESHAYGKNMDRVRNVIFNILTVPKGYLPGVSHEMECFPPEARSGTKLMNKRDITSVSIARHPH